MPPPLAPPADGLDASPPREEDQRVQSRLYVALVIWALGFIALLLWVVADLIIGLLK
ncbi:MAG TPA: hypothetical protein VNK04_23170 [Gemmataceae bacterium]|nr:hypothetical protein [Gemmataceae bacterium]